MARIPRNLYEIFPFLKRLAEKTDATAGRKRSVTPKELQQVFDFSIRFNTVGKGRTGIGGLRGPVETISFSPKPRQVDFRKASGPYKRDLIVDLPAFLKWSASPVFAYLALVDGKLEYRYGANGEAAYHTCPVTTDPERIAQIEEMFRVWYHELELPGSLGKPLHNPARGVDRSDKMALIRRYLEEGDEAFLFHVLGFDDDIVMWVDWRESDDDIVHMCEALIQSGALTADFVPNDVSADLIITYRGVKTRVRYKDVDSDRDTTLITLNALLAPDYEIRMCRESGLGDTVAFLPLSSAQWQSLDAVLPGKVEEKFMKLSAGARIFS